jgi:hypothetical protein
VHLGLHGFTTAHRIYLTRSSAQLKPPSTAVNLSWPCPARRPRDTTHEHPAVTSSLACRGVAVSTAAPACCQDVGTAAHLGRVSAERKNILHAVLLDLHNRDEALTVPRWLHPHSDWHLQAVVFEPQEGRSTRRTSVRALSSFSTGMFVHVRCIMVSTTTWRDTPGTSMQS